MTKQQGKHSALLDTPIAKTTLSQRAKSYCEERGVVLVGEIYQLPFDRDSENRDELTRFLDGHHLPGIARAVALDWRPSYLDNDEIRTLWDRPVGDLFLDSPQQPYEDQRRYGKLNILFGSVDELELSVRAGNALRALEISTVWGLVQYPSKELLETRNFGRKSLAGVEEALKFYELFLEMSEHDLVRYISNVLRSKAPAQE